MCAKRLLLAATSVAAVGVAAGDCSAAGASTTPAAVVLLRRRFPDLTLQGGEQERCQGLVNKQTCKMNIHLCLL